MTRTRILTTEIKDASVTGPKLAMPLVVTDSIQQTMITTPSNPSAGTMRLYPKSDGKFYSLTPAGLEKPLGADDPLIVNNATINQVLTVGQRIDAASGVPLIFNAGAAERYRIATDGKLLVGGASGPFLRPQGAGSLAIEAPTQYLMLHSKSGTHVTGNLYWDGTNWMRYDTAAAASMVVTSSGGINMYTVAAGANPATALVNLMTLNAAGAVSIAGALSGVTTLSMSGTLSAGGVNTGTLGVSGDWIRISSSTLGVYNSVQGVGVYFPDANGPAHYPSGQRLLHNGDVGTGGNQIVRRDANGYITGSYVNLTADIQGGAPAYVAGQNGDNYLRWYPRSTLGLPPTLKSQSFTLSLVTNQAWNVATISGAADGTYLGNQGSYLSVKPGVFHISGTVGGYYSTGFRIYTDGALRVDVNTSQSDFAGGIGGGWCGQVNSSIQFYGRAGVSYSGTVVVTWVSTPSYPS